MSNYKRRRGNPFPNSPHEGDQGRAVQKKVGASAVGDLIAGVVRANGLDKKSPLEPLRAAWRDAVGRTTAASTRLQGFRGGTLTVEVDSAALAQELGVYLKKQLLQRLCETTKVRVKDLRFKVAGRPK